MASLKKSYFMKRLIILATALLFVWVGISCKKGPTSVEEGGLVRPEDKVDVIETPDGMLTPELQEKYTNEMIHIRLISDSSDGVAYYRTPVVITYGNNNKKSMAIFYEKRYGQGGENDVGVDGQAKVDIVYMANDRGGDGLVYDPKGMGNDKIVGNESSASEGAQYSKGSPVVFSKGNEISVVAAAGAGAAPDKTGRGESEIKIAKGTASGSSISFGKWEELNITNNGKSGSEAIREYANEKMKATLLKNGGKLALYTRWGQGKMDGDKWVLPLIVIQKINGGVGEQGALVLYSTNAGASWEFGPSVVFPIQDYRSALGLSVSGDTVKLAAVPRVYDTKVSKPIGIYEGQLNGGGTLTLKSKSSFVDSENNYEMSKSKDGNNSYFINTRSRSGININGFIMNQMLTLALLDGNGDTLKSVHDMAISSISGSGSVAVLEDGTIVTVAEECFAAYVKQGENRFNIVQRRFTQEYAKSRDKVNANEEYYNTDYGRLN